MAYQVTKQNLTELTNPEFPVDVIVRNNGTLLAVHEYLDWDTAVECAHSAIDAGFQVEIEESNGQQAWR